MHKEIGSEFWDYTSEKHVIHKIPERLKWGQDNVLLATGRTALDHIICDIRATQKFNIVYMPSFCCQSMIDPFRSYGIKVIFYNVTVNINGGLTFSFDDDIKCDVVFVMNYFGFLSFGVSVIIDHFKKKNHKIIIEDATHSLFCKEPFNTNSDYVFSSLRKWFAIPGGAVASRKNSEFIIPVQGNIHIKYVNLKIEAMRLKKDYMESSGDDKKPFLETFSIAEKLLEHDYQNYIIDDLSLSIIECLDFDTIRSKRINNAQYLIKGLLTNSKFRLLFEDISPDCCPLFVPIIVEESYRDILKNHLIKNQIFCPVHWPKSNSHTLNTVTKSIYETELSIVCDQRYDLEDMERIVSVIKKY